MVLLVERYSKHFKYIIGGCHCYPATEWYGDVYSAFKKILSDDVVNKRHIREQIFTAVEQLSKSFTNWVMDFHTLLIVMYSVNKGETYHK